MMSFKRGQLVAFTKGFPSRKIKAGDRLAVVAVFRGFPPGKRCSNGLKPTCGFAEHPDCRFYWHDLKAVLVDSARPQ